MRLWQAGGLEFARFCGYVAPNSDDNDGYQSQMATINPIQFIQEVRSQVAKVVWPTRREVFLTTVMVFVMATLTAIFFALVDLGIRGLLQLILSYFG